MFVEKHCDLVKISVDSKEYIVEEQVQGEEKGCKSVGKVICHHRVGSIHKALSKYMSTA